MPRLKNPNIKTIGAEMWQRQRGKFLGNALLLPEGSAKQRKFHEEVYADRASKAADLAVEKLKTAVEKQRFPFGRKLQDDLKSMAVDFSVRLANTRNLTNDTVRKKFEELKGSVAAKIREGSSGQRITERAVAGFAKLFVESHHFFQNELRKELEYAGLANQAVADHRFMAAGRMSRHDYQLKTLENATMLALSFAGFTGRDFGRAQAVAIPYLKKIASLAQAGTHAAVKQIPDEKRAMVKALATTGLQELKVKGF